jgi:hypothetical protein
VSRIWWLFSCRKVGGVVTVDARSDLILVTMSKRNETFRSSGVAKNALHQV